LSAALPVIGVREVGTPARAGAAHGDLVRRLPVIGVREVSLPRERGPRTAILYAGGR
jgi:hypothetical protein